MGTLLTEIHRLRNLMELQNTELKVKLRQGIDYIEVTAMPTNGEFKTFTGEETGTIIPDDQLTSSEIRLALDDGRIVLTTHDAVVEIENVLDANTKDDFINVGTNDTGMSLY